MSSTTYNPANVQAKTAKAAALPQLRAGAETASRSGIWVGVFTITMSFAAFTSALFVREGAGDWQHLALPEILYVNTLILLLSSVTLHFGTKALSAVSVTQTNVESGVRWIAATAALGLLFVAGQYEAWRQLASQGLYLATNPNSSFFYVLTAVHVVHVVGGLGVLVYVLGRLIGGHATFRRSTLGNVSIYWHFMGVLWIYLLIVLRIKL